MSAKRIESARFLVGVAIIFIAGWLAGCFIAWEWSIPLMSSGSRLWLVAAVLINAKWWANS